MPAHSADDYRALLDATRDGVLVTSGGEVTYANRAILSFTGYTEDQLIGSPITDFGTPATRAALLDRHRRRLAGEDLPEVYEIELVSTDGQLIPFEISNHLTTWRGQPAVFSTLRDIRARRARQAAEQALAEHRTQNQRIDALGRIVGGVAHSFNNHLQGIIGYIGLAAEQLAVDHPAQLDLATALRAARRASDTVHQLLQVALPGATDSIAPQDIALDALVQEFQPLLSTVTGRAIRVDMHPLPAGRVHFDPSLLRQVLLNLVLNAKEALDGSQGPDRITISTDTVHFSAESAPAWARAGDWSVLRVQDNGEGMTGDVLQKALDPYFSTRGLGRGLGLPAARAAIHLAGGLLHLDSTPSTGTTVQVLLPCTTPVPTLSAPPQARTVAVVTHSALLRRLLVRLLESGGHQVIACDTPEQARALAHPVDAAVVDGPPDHSRGVILALGEPPHVHIVDPDQAPCDVPCLTRPVERRALLHKLDELLQDD